MNIDLHDPRLQIEALLQQGAAHQRLRHLRARKRHFIRNGLDWTVSIRLLARKRRSQLSRTGCKELSRTKTKARIVHFAEYLPPRSTLSVSGNGIIAKIILPCHWIGRSVSTILMKTRHGQDAGSTKERYEHVAGAYSFGRSWNRFHSFPTKAMPSPLTQLVRTIPADRDPRDRSLQSASIPCPWDISTEWPPSPDNRPDPRAKPRPYYGHHYPLAVPHPRIPM